MVVKRCTRCGSFFASEADTCDMCSNKDRTDVKKIKNYFEQNENISSINELSVGTNITEKNITRLMESNKLSELNIKSIF